MIALVLALAAFAFAGILWALRNDNLSTLEALDDEALAQAVQEWEAWK